MTQKEKAEAYDEALKMAKSKIKNDKNHVLYEDDIIEIFPELKESEDEKIIKWIIDDIRYNMDNEPLNNSEYKKKAKKAIAWLENQGEKDKLIKELGEYKVKYIQEVLEKHINSMSNKDDERLRKTTIAFLKEFADKGYENAVECIDWLERQGEQSIYNVPSREVILAIWDLGNEWKELTNGCISTEHGTQLNYIQKHWEESEYYLRKKQDGQKLTDNIEPKFHEGDWVVDNCSCVWKIEGILNQFYILECPEGGESRPTIDWVDKTFHLWTINDAKDGDILCTYEYTEPKIVFILKGTPKKQYALSYHCYYNIMYPHFAPDTEKGCLAPNDEDVKPATKEQRELLFQKMKESGYEWDVEKKELKKIEKKPEVCI